MFFDANGPMLSGAREAKFKPHPAVQFLLFIAVILVGQLVGGFISGLALVPVILSQYLPLALEGDMDAYIEGIMALSMDPPDYVGIISLFATVITTTAAVLYCRSIEKRSLVSMGLTKVKAVPDYLSGWALGALMFGLATLICAGTGTLRFTGYNSEVSWVMVALFFVGFLFQGMSEEVLLRGYLMTSLSARMPVRGAVLGSSLVFAALHLLNNGITLLAFVNLALFGAFAALFTLRFQRLWGICAVHSAWNFVQGNVLGIEVSGGSYDNTLFSSEAVGSTLINGGSFGLEGGLAVTAVLVLGCLAVVLIPKKRPGDVQ